jgi:hypothetical protein
MDSHGLGDGANESGHCHDFCGRARLRSPQRPIAVCGHPEQIDTHTDERAVAEPTNRSHQNGPSIFARPILHHHGWFIWRAASRAVGFLLLRTRAWPESIFRAAVITQTNGLGSGGSRQKQVLARAMNSLVPMVDFCQGDGRDGNAHGTCKANEQHSPVRQKSKHPQRHISSARQHAKSVYIKSRSRYRHPDIEKKLHLADWRVLSTRRCADRTQSAISSRPLLDVRTSVGVKFGDCTK